MPEFLDLLIKNLRRAILLGPPGLPKRRILDVSDFRLWLDR